MVARRVVRCIHWRVRVGKEVIAKRLQAHVGTSSRVRRNWRRGQPGKRGRAHRGRRGARLPLPLEGGAFLQVPLRALPGEGLEQGVQLEVLVLGEVEALALGPVQHRLWVTRLAEQRLVLLPLISRGIPHLGLDAVLAPLQQRAELVLGFLEELLLRFGQFDGEVNPCGLLLLLLRGGLLFAVAALVRVCIAGLRVAWELPVTIRCSVLAFHHRR
mmetsp:Transcript_136525/g.236933  ORF Transcript_136525/g.236933 Transcript_136525/m.236933 type:complete len:215 (-) Transcript_136525:592-1236(-)